MRDVNEELFRAIDENKPEGIRIAIQNGADVLHAERLIPWSGEDFVTYSPMDLAADLGHLEAIQYLAENLDEEAWSVLEGKSVHAVERAIRRGHNDLILWLVENTTLFFEPRGYALFDINGKRRWPSDHHLPLTILISSHNYEIAATLIPKFEARDVIDALALIPDSQFALLDTAIAAGIKLEHQKGRSGKTLAFLVCDRVSYLKVLKEKDVNMHTENSNGVTLLHVAAQKKALKSVEWLCDLRLNPNKTDKYGNAPLHFACDVHYNEKPDAVQKTVECLVRHKADLNKRNAGCSPLKRLFLTRRSSEPLNIQCALWMLEHGAKMDGRENEGRWFLQHLDFTPSTDETEILKRFISFILLHEANCLVNHHTHHLYTIGMEDAAFSSRITARLSLTGSYQKFKAHPLSVHVFESGFGFASALEMDRELAFNDLHSICRGTHGIITPEHAPNFLRAIMKEYKNFNQEDLMQLLKEFSEYLTMEDIHLLLSALNSPETCDPKMLALCLFELSEDSEPRFATLIEEAEKNETLEPGKHIDELQKLSKQKIEILAKFRCRSLTLFLLHRPENWELPAFTLLSRLLPSSVSFELIDGSVNFEALDVELKKKLLDCIMRNMGDESLRPQLEEALSLDKKDSEKPSQELSALFQRNSAGKRLPEKSLDDPRQTKHHASELHIN